LEARLLRRLPVIASTAFVSVWIVRLILATGSPTLMDSAAKIPPEYDHREVASSHGQGDRDV